MSPATNVTRPIVLVTSSAMLHHPRMYHLMARALSEKGLPVVVVGQADTLGALPGIGEHELPRRRGRLARMASAPLVLWRVARLNPAAVGVHSLDLLPLAVLLRMLRGVPVTYDSNEDYASFMLIKEWLPRPLRVPLSRIVGTVEPWLAGRLDATTVADVGTSESFAERGVQTLVIRNFASLAMTGEQPDADPIYDVLYHGTLPPYYMDQIVATAVRLKDLGASLRWCIAIRDSTSHETAVLERWLEDVGLRESFTLFHDRPFQEMPGLIAQSRMGLIPWPDEPKFRRNFPRKVFELMAVGRPAVVSDLPPTRALLGELDCCVLVRPGDTDAYADAILDLIADSDRAERIGRNGKRLIRERFNAEAETERYVDLYRTLTGVAGTSDAEKQS